MSGGHGGRRPGAGRPKGRVSDETAAIKEMVIGALQDVGGREYLAARAIDTPGAFMVLVGKVLPLQITGEGGGPLMVITGVERDDGAASDTARDAETNSPYGFHEED